MMFVHAHPHKPISKPFLLRETGSQQKLRKSAELSAASGQGFLYGSEFNGLFHKKMFIGSTGKLTDFRRSFKRTSA